ncbi:hypothetical protein AK830_g7750 [Neonectria ditissima]|uniref:Uncharacterized protein n=1 Tax=Neonectria ditissima TaxID=78410 RepID=A0A0P7BE34_9HYPO|nr:hypothetical protein AK830_g7750 [Neonectria ditissima]
MALNYTFAEVVSRPTCPVQGNSDLYGLGNRLGIYIQMLTVQLSSFLSSTRPVEDRIGQATIVFILATATVLLRLISSRQIEAVEVVPILGLISAQIGVCRVPVTGSKITLLIYVGEMVGILALFTWFWWKGMDDLPRSCKHDYAFFFAKVSIWGWFRRLNQALGIISVVGACLTYFLSLINFVSLVIRNVVDEDLMEQLGSSTGKVEMTVNIGIIVFVEVSLRWNHITDVHSLSSPGQFMPFFIALAQLVSTLYRFFDPGEGELEEEDDSVLECSHGHGRGGSSGTTDDVENIPMDNVENIPMDNVESAALSNASADTQATQGPKRNVGPFPVRHQLFGPIADDRP